MASKRMRKSVARPASSGNISVTVSSGVAVSAKSTSRTSGDHVGVSNLGADGGKNSAGLNVSANTAFSVCEVSGHRQDGVET
jgi:hypothetical protein